MNVGKVIFLFLVRNILLFCDTAISHSNIDIRIVTKKYRGSPVHRRIIVSDFLLPRTKLELIVQIKVVYISCYCVQVSMMKYVTNDAVYKSYKPFSMCDLVCVIIRKCTLWLSVRTLKNRSLAICHRDS